MTDENKEKETLENQEENETPKNEEDLEIPETPQEEKPEGKSKELQSALAQKDHWRKKAEEAEKQLKSKPPESASQGEKDEWKSKVNFLLQNQDKKYSEEEFGHIAVVATQSDISLKEAAKQEDEYIQFKREKVEKDNAPEPSTKQGESKQEKPVSEMTLDEKGKYFSERGFTKPFPKAKPL